jgi:hypothetical protein
VTLSDRRLRAISRAVQDAGGDLGDAEDLAEACERLERVWGPRVDRMRYEAAHPRCCCARGPAELEDGRCSRCWGLVVDDGSRPARWLRTRHGDAALGAQR